MDCFLSFFDELHQEKLRNIAQLSSKSFEEVLEIYKKTYLAYMQEIKTLPCNNNGFCSMMKKDSYQIGELCHNRFRKIIEEIDVNEIASFFDEIREIYLEWIDLKWQSSIERLRTLLISKGILSSKYDDYKHTIYYRGRKSNSILTPWDMFHIPFDKRYLIKNQRYSITGQPLLYLATSVLDIQEELELQNCDGLYVSSIVIKGNCNIFDIRNNFFYKIKEYCNDLSNTKGDYNYAMTDLLKDILASICSFARRRNSEYHFSEEYVIPQLLAQLLKNENFDGIIYKCTKNIEVEHDSYLENDYINNIVMFTNYNQDHNYDKTLYDKVKISNPIVGKYASAEPKDVDALYNILDKLNNKDTDSVECMKNIRIMYTKFNKIYSNIKINGTDYLETDAGKIQLQLVYNYLNKILANGGVV